MEWFREAEFGLFLHYGLYSLLAGEWKGQPMPSKGSEWIQLIMEIPVHEYAQLRDRFTADQFDADQICRIAKDAGMRYVNLTTQHHDGFCLWDTSTTDFSSMHAPAGRDLVRELTDACDVHGLGCFLYYSHGRDWWHPDSPLNNAPSCRPRIEADHSHFHWGEDYEINRYLDLVEAQVLELCAYKNVAGIWLDGIGTFKNMEDGVHISRAAELYEKVHASSPSIMVAYKQGLTYTEDFFAPERSIQGMHLAEGQERPFDPPLEICTTLQPQSWGYKRSDDGQHRSVDWVMDQLKDAQEIPANLLLNTGPMGDGRIPDEDVRILQEVGRRRRSASHVQ